MSIPDARNRAMAEFEKTLLAEIEALVADLAANPQDPRLLKLQKLNDLAKVYGVTGASLNGAVISAAQKSRPATVQRPRASSASRQAILDRAKGLIALGGGEPVPTVDLFDTISSEMEIPGNNPKNNLSAMLSNSDEFISHGRAGWTLAETQRASDDLLTRQTSEAPVSSAAIPTAEPSVRPVDPVPGGGT
jgi:hypothetical protein